MASTQFHIGNRPRTLPRLSEPVLRLVVNHVAAHTESMLALNPSKGIAVSDQVLVESLNVCDFHS